MTSGSRSSLGFGGDRDVWRRQEWLRRMLLAGPYSRVDLFSDPFFDILRESDRELMCWRLAQEIPARTNGWLPVELERYRDRADLAARWNEHVHAELEENLEAWVRDRRTSAERTVRVVFRFDRHDDVVPHLALEVRSSGPRLHDEVRTLAQLGPLRAQARRTPGLLSSEQLLLLETLTDGETLVHDEYTAGDEITLGGLLRLLERFSGSSGMTWGEEIDPEFAQRFGIEAGSAVRLSSHPVSVLPTCSSEGETLRVELGYFWPGGRELRPGQVFHVRPRSGERPGRSLVLADGEFSIVAEQPPVELMEQFESSGGLPVTPERAKQVLAPLAAKFATVRGALAPHTRHHSARAVFALDLDAHDWLQIRLFARTPEIEWRPGAPVPAAGAVFEYHAEGGWARVSAGTTGTAHELGAVVEAPVEGATDATGLAPVPAPERRSAGGTREIWFEAPEPGDVEASVHWLQLLGATAGGARGPGGQMPPEGRGQDGWWMRLNARTAPALADAWEARPAGADWFGSDRLRAMLTGALRPKRSLRVESSGVDWFSISAEWQAEGLALNEADLARLRGSNTRFVKISTGWVRRELAMMYDETAEALADLGLEAGGGPQKITLWQLAQARPETLDALESLGLDPIATRNVEELRKRVAEFRGLPEIPLPARVTAELRPYQHRGLDFLAYTSSLGLGAVLADDMGLGKTVQALAWLEWLRDQGKLAGPTLVVCPASVTHNWLREAERFVPGMRVLLLESGVTRERLHREIESHDLLVTNYALLRRDLEKWKAAELGAVILDEAQNVKNPDAQVSRAVLELRAPHRLALTGTPLENRALDLWSIMAFVNPGYLGSRARFVERYDRPDAPPHLRRLLAAKLRPVMLRRLKKEVAPELPPRIEERRDCEMTRGQRHLYLEELVKSRAQISTLSTGEGVKKHRIEILAVLTKLRQLCCHPALAGGKRSLGSGKFDALFELLEPLLAEGHKVLLFSQFVRCLDLLAEELDARGIPRHMLVGATKKRERVVAAFDADPNPCVFLISLKAGGTGLNLTAANYVVLFDPWWNPAVEAQAIDRTHRIGQNRTVIAYRMLTQGTIEEKIWDLQQKKAALARHVLGEESFARGLTKKDLEYLLAEE